MNFRQLVISTAILTATASAFAADYVIDTTHSSVNFTANHLGFSKTVGRFNEFEGKFNDEKGTAEIVIKATSIDSNHEPRDKHLRSPDFFDVKQYPEISFKNVKINGDKLVGDLTMHGKTNQVELDLSVVGEGEDPWGGYRKGYEATGTINRSDWGIDYFIPAVPDAIELEIQVEGIRQ